MSTNWIANGGVTLMTPSEDWGKHITHTHTHTHTHINKVCHLQGKIPPPPPQLCCSPSKIQFVHVKFLWPRDSRRYIQQKRQEHAVSGNLYYCLSSQWIIWHTGLAFFIWLVDQTDWSSADQGGQSRQAHFRQIVTNKSGCTGLCDNTRSNKFLVARSWVVQKM